MDYARLRAAALKDGEAEEAVTVDTRALIDKVLARYSGEWTTLRELIQNAADAQATSVKIKWETLPSTQVPLPSTTNRSELLKHALTNHTLRRLLVENNGQPFTPTDWGRLKRIAEGNPDETKIGAFGVGFYSVFADCEEPFVSSGSEAMAFYWKGHALFTRKLQLPPVQTGPNTTFVLDYRNTATPLPNLLSVSQFLATSLTFVALQNIEFWIDDWKILSLQKKASPSLEIPIPRDLETKTREGLMRLASVERTSVQIDATFMSVVGWKPQAATSVAKAGDTYFAAPEMNSLRSFFSKLTSNPSQTGLRGKAAKEEREAQEAIKEDLTATSSSSIFLRVTTGSINTHVTASFAIELERATKKPAPKVTKLAILTSSYDETVASEASSTAGAAVKATDVFSTVLPSKKPGGRIFIGFPTTQTTGAGMHISAPSVIPTVEREAIDLNARWVRNWNVELLRVAGVITRLAFSNEMQDLSAKLQRTTDSKSPRGPSAADVARFVPEAMHILKTYSFSDSTPSGNVGQIIEEAFWTAYRRPSIEVYSSRGVLLTTKVRKTFEDLSKFVDGIPVILEEMKDAPFIRKLTDFELIKSITVDDVYSELSAKALNKDQLHHFISWAGKSAASGELDPPSKQRLLDVAVATVSESGDQGDIIALGSITNYLSQNKIPPSLPIPPTTLPFMFTTNVPVHHLQALGWEALEIVPWLRFLIDTASSKGDDQNLLKSPEFAFKILGVLSKNWDGLSASSKTSVVDALQNITVMPTKMGMKKPGESFFPSVKLFDDLPTLQNNQGQGIKEKFLVALGVRKTVDLETIFTRLLSPSPESEEKGQKKWSHVELIKYLASVKDDIPAADMKKLKESKLCPAEAGPLGMEPTKGTTELFKVSSLFEPKDTLRALGLRILQWPGPPGSYRPSSPEARFLVTLGLRPFPTVIELVDMMASSDISLRTKAMTYFIANHHINGYASFDIGTTTKAFLPLQGIEKALVAPSECYTDEGATVLGFNILRKDLHQHASKFGVARDPPIVKCVNRLVANPPQSRQAATKLFEYFTTRLGDLGENSLSRLRDSEIVPVVRQGSRSAQREGKPQTASVVLVRPQQCYLGSSSTYGDIFDFVDFGTNANTFLFKCGARTEPSKVEIAKLACSEPARLLGILQSPEKYLNLLRTLAEDWSSLKRDRELLKQMKSSPFLLASREISVSKTRGSAGVVDEEDDAPIKQYQLATASQIAINDDYKCYSLFKDSLICAPEEDRLETFYQDLGSQLLSSMIKEDLRIGPHSEKQDGADWLRKHVIERSKLFLYEYSKYTRDPVKHDARWLEKNLAVEAVRNVSLRRSLRGQTQSHVEKRSAASANTGKGWVLYVAADGRPDMYQVGMAVCQLLLNRPSQQAYFFFEPFLKLDLLELRGRGYNVDRILRAKAAEARIAEEERRLALEAEQKRIVEAAQDWTRQTETESLGTPNKPKEKTPRAIMPGSFADSPEESRPPTPPSPHRHQHKGKGLFSNLSRRFGFDSSEGLENRHDDIAEEPIEPATIANGKPQPNKPRGGDDGRVTSPAVVHQNLLKAIQSTRAHDSSTLFSPPRADEVREQAAYCDRESAKNIVFAAEAPGGMRIFVSRSMAADPMQFLAARSAPIAHFERLLAEVGNVYGIRLMALHMFYDETGSTIAFNSKGSIFCNLRYFLQLHANTFESKSGETAEARAEATVWWWVVVAHELAHNLVDVHNADHSYYTESFIQQYFHKLAAKMSAKTGTPAAIRTSSAGAPRVSSSSERPLPLAPPPPYSVGGGAAGYGSLLD